MSEKCAATSKAYILLVEKAKNLYKHMFKKCVVFTLQCHVWVET